MVVSIYIGDDKLDLFGDENIEVQSSVSDIEDITLNTTDFTKTFTVPASNDNNITFVHYYDADIDNSFDARIKVDGRIELDGMLFRKGKFRLSKVSVKKGLPSSYTINFWGNLLTISDAVQKDELKDLDLTAFDHEYNSDNVKLGLTSSLFSGDVIYNLFVKKQLFYNSDVNDTTITDTLINIGWGNGSGDNGVTWNDLRPSIRLIKIIEAIEADYDITFTRDFFGRTEFNNLFMWMNSEKKSEIDGTEITVDFDGGSTTNVNLTTNIGTFDTENSPRRWWRLYQKIIPSVGFENVEYTIKYFRDDDESGSEVEEIAQITKSGTFEWLNNLHAQGAETIYKVFYTVSSNQEFKFTTSLFQQRKNFFGNDGNFTTTSSEQTITSDFEVENNLPKLKIIDFLRGIFKMFKLVVIPLPDGTTFVNTLKSYYAQGGIFNITKHVDFEEYDVNRGKILNEINFLFEEPKTILNVVFKENFDIAYGDQETKLADEDGTILDGETLEFKLPFEQILYERLNDIEDAVLTNIQYGAIINDNLEPVNPKTHIFYNINQSIGTKTIGFIDDNGVKTQLSGNINTPSHTIGLETSNFSTIFDSEFSTWNGQRINNTLYTNYHEDYVLSIFNIKRRSFKYNAILPLSILLKLELNDVLQIKDNYFRIDNFKTNLVTGKVELNLINSFDNTIDGFSATPTDFFAEGESQQLSTYVTNLGNFSFNKVDTGDGIGWVAVTNDTNNVFFDLDQNTDGFLRSIVIDLTNLLTLQVIRINITQEGALVTFDSTDVTFDNTLITWDNA